MVVYTWYHITTVVYTQASNYISSTLFVFLHALVLLAWHVCRTRVHLCVILRKYTSCCKYEALLPHLPLYYRITTVTAVPFQVYTTNTN